MSVKGEFPYQDEVSQILKDDQVLLSVGRRYLDVSASYLGACMEQHGRHYYTGAHCDPQEVIGKLEIHTL